MKKIEAIVEPSDVEGMKDALARVGVRAMTVTEVKDFGGNVDPEMQVYRGRRYEAPFLTEAKIEIIAADDVMERAVAVIRETAKTDASGESRIFVFPLEQVMKGETGKKSVAAVS